MVESGNKVIEEVETQTQDDTKNKIIQNLFSWATTIQVRTPYSAISEKNYCKKDLVTEIGQLNQRRE